MKLVIEHHPWKTHPYAVYLTPTQDELAAAGPGAVSQYERQMLYPEREFIHEADAHDYCKKRQAGKTIAEYQL